MTETDAERRIRCDHARGNMQRGDPACHQAVVIAFFLFGGKVCFFTRSSALPKLLM